MKAIFYILFSLLLPLNCLAQNSEPLEKKYLDKDMEALKLLSRLVPPINRSLESISKVMGPAAFEDDRGFGATDYTFGIGNGYTSLSVYAFFYKDKVIRYKVSVYYPKEVKPIIINAWKQNTDVNFKETKDHLYYEESFPEVLEDFKKEVTRELGNMKPVNVPADLAESYKYLISPTENSAFGYGGCGYGGSILQGRKAINLIVKANRIDLLENILRGHNPGGRVYAALSLLEMEKQGLKLSFDAQNGIRKISDLNIKIETCSGCIISHNTAKQLIETPKELLQ